MIGDDVLKHVATRVTIDGTPSDGSPIEVYFIEVSSMLETAT